MKTRAILLVDHGSRLEEANRILVEVAALVARADPRYHVEAAHMELATPTIAQGIAACVAAGASDITIHPYMLGPGRHATRDIPRLAAEAAAAHPGIVCRVTEPLGIDPLIARVVLERVRAAEIASLSAAEIASLSAAGIAALGAAGIPAADALASQAEEPR